jgi:hypothetical protein
MLIRDLCILPESVVNNVNNSTNYVTFSSNYGYLRYKNKFNAGYTKE